MCQSCQTTQILHGTLVLWQLQLVVEVGKDWFGVEKGGKKRRVVQQSVVLTVVLSHSQLMESVHVQGC